MTNQDRPEQHGPAPYHAPGYHAYGPAPYYGGPYGEAHDPDSIIGELSPRRIWRIVRRKWLMIGLAALTVLGVGYVYLHVKPNVYKAEALIEMSVRRPRIMAQEDAVIEHVSGRLEEIFNTRLEKLKGRETMLAGLERLLESHPDAFLPPEGEGHAGGGEENIRAHQFSRFRDSIDLSLIRNTTMLRVEFRHTDPELAAAASNAFAEAAEAVALEENRRTSDAAVIWLQMQAESQSEELQGLDDALMEYRKEHQIDGLESQRRAVRNAVEEFNQDLVRLESREVRERDLRETLEDIEIQPELAGRLPEDVPRSEDILTALAGWREVRNERDNLLDRYTEQHPEVQAKNRRAESFRGQVSEAIERARDTVVANHRLIRQQAESIRRRIEEHSQRASELESQIVEHQARLESMERQREAANETHRGILNRIQDARIAADEQTATIKSAEPATVPSVPVEPRPIRVLALALILGLGGGMGLALVSDTLEDRVSSPDDVTGYGFPIHAVIPHVKTGDRTEVALSVLRSNLAPVAEAYAGLRAVLDSPQYKDQNRVILVASSAPEEGKTVTSCNLSASWARRGQRVLLIDFDIRRPRLAGIFPLPEGTSGLQAALHTADHTFDPASLAYPSADCPNLHIISSRVKAGSSPSDVVASSSVAKLMDWARETYDHVIIDVPPLGIISDGIALAGYADRVLLMVRAESSRRRLALHAIQRFREAGIDQIGLVVNDVDFSKTAYGSYSPYRYYSQQYSSYMEGAER